VTSARRTASRKDEPARAESSTGLPRFSVDYLDRRADPTIDFFRFATGRWSDTHPIPADKTRWSGFDELRERNFRAVRRILEEAARARRTTRDAARQKVGTMYAASLDSAGRRRRGLEPVEAERQAIEEIRSVEGLATVVARLHGVGVAALFAPEIAPDDRHSGVYALYLSQGGLSLPDRDYYLLDSFSAVRAAYREHVGHLLRLAGDSPTDAARSAAAVVEVETALARASRTRVALRDPAKNYHRFAPASLARRYRRFDWAEYLRLRGRRRPEYLVVGQPEFFGALDRLLGKIPPERWKSYLRWQLIHDSAPHLDAPLVDEDFAFFHRRLLGQERPEPAWKRAAEQVDGALGEALGRLYVERHFPPEVRARMLELVRDLNEVVRDRLERVPWMTAGTRRRAVAKFDRFTTKIGHPEKYRSYARVRVAEGDHLGNLRRAWAAEIARNLARVGKPVDRNEWRMTPPTVNAHFVPTQNEIFFPAGILQPPFFDPAADDAVNYGGIAVVIGHEITHGYDDQGRKYDANGNLRDWWTPADAREFGKRSQRIVDQYSRFEPLPGLHLNGALTAGENIADLGGVSLAFEALERRLADGRTPDRPIDGFTPRQRFFLSYGQIWRGSMRDEEARRRVATDPHSPGRFRVNGALANLPEFWKAFDVPPGAPMRQAPDRQVVIW